MSKKFLVALIMVLGCMSLQGQIKINTAADLANINNNGETLNENYLLMTDLTLKEWTPIGQENDPFTGTFDGNGYTITIVSFRENLSVEKGAFSAIGVGLFGFVGYSAVVGNLIVAGDLKYNSGEITLYMGAIAGDNKGIINNCVSTANIDASGGAYSAKKGTGQFLLSGLASSSNPQNNTILIGYQNEACGGGIAGLNRNMIMNCYTTGNITVSGNGHKTAGGVAGRNGFINTDGMSFAKGHIVQCYATGNILAKEDIASRLAGGITSICMPGDVINCVALNEKLETIGKRKGMTIGGLGLGYPSNVAFGVVASAFDAQQTATLIPYRGTAKQKEEVRNYALELASIAANKSTIKNAYYRNDMTVNMLKDEEDEKENKSVKKNVLLGNRGKEIDYVLTQEQSWWMDEKSGISFPFGTEENHPWAWDNTIKRPILYWQTEEGKTIKINQSEIDFNEYANNKNKVTHNKKSTDDATFFSYCSLYMMNEDLPKSYTWNEANNSCPEGWRLPTVSELQCICQYKSHATRFNGKEYWTSEIDKKGNFLSVTTNDCKSSRNSEDEKYSVRCVKTQ